MGIPDASGWQPPCRRVPPWIIPELDPSSAGRAPAPSPFLPPFPPWKQAWTASFPSPYYFTVLPWFAKPLFILFPNFCVSTPSCHALNAGPCRPPPALPARSGAHQPRARRSWTRAGIRSSPRHLRSSPSAAFWAAVAFFSSFFLGSTASPAAATAPAAKQNTRHAGAAGAV